MKAVTGCLLSCIFPFSVLAQESTLISGATRLSAPIEFDGIVSSDEGWSGSQQLPFTMHWPNYNGDLTEITQVYLSYDDEYIYMAAICYDSSPEKVQRPTFQRDEWNEVMDQVALVIDSYNDNENALVFVTSASGSRVDATVKNDAQGGGAVSESWNSYWDSRVSEFDGGWQLEMRIPFSSLRFQVSEGLTNMGIGVYRYIPRKNELQVYPDIPPDWGYWSFVKPSMLNKTSFQEIESKRPWYISPYGLGGLGYHHEYDLADNPDKINDDNFQLGLDVQHAFSDNLNADFTINTDFAQVEADDQTVNLSRFSLFFPEKRRFFLERSSTFDFNADGNNNLFYSRRIGINGGELIPMLGGVRLVGRFNSWDVGLINMQSQSTSDFASENYGVMRLRRNVFNTRSYVGGMFTSRVNPAGDENYAFGLDGVFNLFGDDYLQVNVAQSADDEDPNGLNAADRARIYLLWENRKTRGFGYNFSYSNVGEWYNPGLGFERRFNFSEFQSQLSYLWFVDEARDLRTIELGLGGETSFQNSTGNKETQSIGGSLSLSWDRNNSLSMSATFLNDRVPGNFRLSDEIEIVADEYNNTEYSLSYNTAPNGLIKSSFSTQFGSFYGGDMISASITPTAVLSKHITLSGFYQYSNIEFSELGETFESHLTRLKLDLSFNVKWGVSSFAQLNSINEISTLNLRLRYNPVDGNDLYLVFNEVINNKPENYTPFLPNSESRALMIKYIHTFKL